MSVPDFRPLSFGEIMDGAFTLYRRNFPRFAGTSFLLMAGLFAGSVVLGGTGGAIMAVMPGAMAFLVGVLVAVGIAALVTMLGSALTWQAARSYAGKPVSLAGALRAAGAAAMTLVGAGLIAALTAGAMMFAGWLVVYVFIEIVGALGIPALTVIGTLLGMLGMGVAGFFVAGLFFGVLPAVMVEEKGPVEALSRSIQLATGALPRIAGTLFVTMVIVVLPFIAIVVVSDGFTEVFNPGSAGGQGQVAALLEELLAWLMIVLMLPFIPAVLVMLYYDRRVRTEALDVQILTEQLGLAGA